MNIILKKPNKIVIFLKLEKIQDYSMVEIEQKNTEILKMYIKHWLNFEY